MGVPERNFSPGPVLRGPMGRVAKRAACVAVLAVALVLSAAAPVRAHVGVFVGVGPGWGYPGPYPYAYPYPYPYYAPYPYAYPAAVAPPGWVPGRWEWRYDPWGRRYRAWIPAHLQ